METTKQDIQQNKLKDYGLVSIIMPNYNSGKYISESIESVLAQTYENWELIVVDDCSSDDSIEVIKSYSDPRIKLIQNEKNSGAAISRNNAIAVASGEFIAFLDSDDLWTTDKLQRHLEFMVDNDKPFSCTSYSVVKDGSDKVVVFSPKKDEYRYEDILKHCYIGCSTVIYNAKVLGKVYMPTRAEKREDLACWLQILKRKINVTCFHENLTTYRVHGKSVS